MAGAYYRDGGTGRSPCVTPLEFTINPTIESVDARLGHLRPNNYREGAQTHPSADN